MVLNLAIILCILLIRTLAKKFIYIIFILPCSSIQRVRRISQNVDVYPENTSLSLNAGIILARVVDGGPTLTQHWSFVVRVLFIDPVSPSGFKAIPLKVSLSTHLFCI